MSANVMTMQTNEKWDFLKDYEYWYDGFHGFLIQFSHASSDAWEVGEKIRPLNFFSMADDVKRHGKSFRINYCEFM